MASVFQDKIGQINKWSDLLPLAGYVGLPFLLVLKQPDLGTSLVFMAIFIGMIFACGVNLKLLAWMFGVAMACAPLIWHFVLKEYQKMRIMVFMDPNVDPLGSGYHIIQSKIAIGSGMLFGKGLFAGTQSQLNFLPENHTDFIFAVVGEELGFIGATILYIGTLHLKICTMHGRRSRINGLSGSSTLNILFDRWYGSWPLGANIKIGALKAENSPHILTTQYDGLTCTNKFNAVCSAGGQYTIDAGAALHSCHGNALNLTNIFSRSTQQLLHLGRSKTYRPVMIRGFAVVILH